MNDGPETVFRLAYVPGVMPAKWARVWAERRPAVPLELIEVAAADAVARLTARDVDAALVRTGVTPSDPAIELYEETTVVVVPKDHVFTAVDELPAEELSDEQRLLPLDDVLRWGTAPGTVLDHRPETTADAVELVAAGIGVLLVPQSLARLHHRKDLTYVPVTDAPGSAVGLTWCEPASDDVAEFIGIVRGRRASSSRGDQPVPKRTAREKALARQERQAAAGKIPQRRTAKKSAPRRSRRR